MHRGEIMTYKITYKAFDNKKAYTLTVIKWGNRWYTTDEVIPELEEKQKPQRQKWYEENLLNSDNPFIKGPKLASLPVAFSKKVREQIGEDILKASYRTPTAFIFENADYNIQNGTLWINGMTHFEKRSSSYNRGSRE
jgi:hypothetical protein